MISKTKLREILIKKRKTISLKRREEASLILKETLYSKGRVLSFAPLGSEIDLTLLNNALAREDRLYLMPYLIDSTFTTPLSQIDCVLVPALGFDRDHYRIGYGKGFYDRFLITIGDIPTIGIGFKEQICDELLPRDPWDIPVKELLLV